MRNTGRLRAMTAGTVAAVVALGIAAPALADVLVEYVPSSVSCRDGIKVGIWYQSYSGGPRTAKITIKNSSGKTVWSKSAKATETWRYWRYHGTCGKRYTVRYLTAGGTSTFHTRIRPAS